MSGTADAKGFVIIMVALLLVVMLGFAALAIDVGMLFTARTAAQRAADAAALAGAFTFVVSPGAIQPDTASSHALDVARSARILNHGIQDGDVTVQVDAVNRRVTVDLSHIEGSYFASVLGISSGTIRVRAVAEAAKNAVGAFCAKPWFIPNTLLSTAEVCGTMNACNTNQVLILPDKTVNTAIFTPGQPILVKPGNPQVALVPGQFYCVRLGDSTGGNDYRTNISTCSPEIISCQKTYSVEPGNMIGPTNQGVDDLIGQPPDTFFGEDPVTHELLYLHPDGKTSPVSRSLVVAPIWDVCSMGAYCDKDKFQLPDGGANIQIPVVGFAFLFIKGVVGNDVEALLIGVFPCGWAPPASDDETGPYSIPVRLVRVPGS